jgi:hypothetical protein
VHFTAPGYPEERHPPLLKGSEERRSGQKNENKLVVKPVTLNHCSQNPLIMAARIFNKMPAGLKVIEEDQIFARKLKKFYMNICFTTFTSS